MKLFQIVNFLAAIWAALKENLNIEEISKDGLKETLGRFKDLFGYTRVTPERAEKFFEVAKIVKDMGGIDALHEGLTEMQKAGLLNEFTDMFNEKDPAGKLSGGIARSQVVTLNLKGARVVECASAEIGYSESPHNSNMTKYGEWFGFNGVAWCGIFVSWVYAQAQTPLPNIGFTKGFAGCITAMKYFIQSSQITFEPKPGDLVFFDWNKDGLWDHVGIFVRWLDDGRDNFETIEGNTSSTNQSNGGQVQRRERSARSNYTVQMIHPKVLD